MIGAVVPRSSNGLRVTKLCPSCERTFEVIPSKADNAKYCSRQCVNERSLRYCRYCGNAIRGRKHQNKVFCSCICSTQYLSEHPEKTPGFKTGVYIGYCEKCGERMYKIGLCLACRRLLHIHKSGDYGPMWDNNTRVVALMRDNYTCQSCGSPSKKPQCFSQYRCCPLPGKSNNSVSQLSSGIT